MLLCHYLQKIGLPNTAIELLGEVSGYFLKKDILTLWSAIEYIHKLPYGRTTDRANYLQVLREERGACSVKHALIAALAEELNIPLTLTLGIFLLTAENMPKIIPILHRYHLEAIPEAHCYLKFNNHTLDITFPDKSEFSFNPILEQEMTITPQQIGEFKVEEHQAFIKRWVENKTDLNFKLVWTAREQWIRELSQA